MNILSLKIIASLVALFGLGAGSGFVVAKRTSATAFEPPARLAPIPPALRTNLSSRYFGRWADRRVANYRQTLNLTPSQEAAVRSHLEAMASEYDSLSADVRSRMAQALLRSNAAIARELTPEQRRTFWQQLRERSRKVEE